MRPIAKFLIIGLLLSGSMLSVPATRADQAAATLPQTTDTADIPALGRALPATDLEQQSGGKDLSLTLGDVNLLNNDMDQNAQSSSNFIVGITNTGSNYVTDDAFKNASGIATLIQNTGNQVIIQNGMNLNVLVK